MPARTLQRECPLSVLNQRMAVELAKPTHKLNHEMSDQSERADVEGVGGLNGSLVRAS